MPASAKIDFNILCDQGRLAILLQIQNYYPAICDVLLRHVPMDSAYSS